MDQLWEDWINLILGIAVLFVPAYPSIAATGALAITAYITGGLIVVVAAVGLAAPQQWEEWVNLVLGAWLIVLPFAYGIASSNAGASLIVLGVLVVIFAIWALVDLQQHTTSRA